MGKRRCVFDNERVDIKALQDVSGFLIHMEDQNGTWVAVDPPHEAIEGRLLQPDGTGFKLKVPIQLRPTLARQAD